MSVNKYMLIIGPSKKNRKRDQSTRRLHSSSRQHRHVFVSYSQSPPDSIFASTAQFSNFIQSNLDGTSYNIICLKLIADIKKKTICLKHLIFHPWLIS